MTPSTVTLIVLLLMLLCYITRIIPAGATSLIVALLMVLTGVIDLQTVFAPFMGNIILLLIGVMIIGGAFTEVGNADDIGNLLIKRLHCSENKMIIFLMIFVILVSLLLSSTTSVAMFLPIVDAISKASQNRVKRKNLYLPVAIASIVGGNAVLFSSTPQLTAQAILQSSNIDGVHELKLFDLLPGALVIAVATVLFYILIGCRLQNRCFQFEENEAQYTDSKAKNKSVYKKINVYLAYVVFLVLFVTKLLPIGISALVGALICVVTRCISEKKAFASVNWTTILTVGGLLGFSEAMTASNLCQKIVNTAIGIFDNGTLTSFAGYAILVVIAVVLTSVVSNTAVAAIMVPISLEMAVQTGGKPMVIVVGMILASSVSYCTPIATPSMTMAGSIGYRFSDYLTVGGLLSIVLTAMIIFVVPLIYS